MIVNGIFANRINRSVNPTYGANGAILPKAQVSFGGNYSGLMASRIVSSVDNLPCPYTGTPMLSSYGFYTIEQSVKTSTGEALRKIFGACLKYVHGIHRNVVEEVSAASLKFPDMKLNDLFAQLVDAQSVRLQSTQLAIIRGLQNKSAKIKDEATRRSFIAYLDSIKELIDDGDVEKFRRSDFLKECNNRLVGIPSSVAEEIKGAADSIPTPKTNPAAFILHYSTPNTTQHCVLTNLLTPSLASVDHLVGREDVNGNLIPVSMIANNKRGNRPLAEYLATVANVKDSMARFFSVLDLVQDIDVQKYAKEVKATIKKEAPEVASW